MKIRKKLPKGLQIRNGVYYLRAQIDGKRKTISLETRDLGEALALAVERKQELLIGQNKQALGSAVEDFLKHCKQGIHRRVKTTNGYTSALKQLVDYLGANRQLTTITDAHIDKFFKELKKNGKAVATLHSYLRIQKVFFTWCTQTNPPRLRQSPAAETALPKLGNKLHRSDPFCTVEQQRKLIESTLDPDMKFILYAGFDAGLRKLEICEARRDWFHIDGEKNYIHVLPAEGARLRGKDREYFIKDSSERYIPLRPEFTAFLQGYLVGRQPLDFALRPDKIHRKFEYRVTFDKSFKAFVDSQNMPWVTPHTMRRTFASLLVQSGVSLSKVASWMGDGIDVVIRHYAYLNENDDDINRGHEIKTPLSPTPSHTPIAS